MSGPVLYQSLRTGIVVDAFQLPAAGDDDTEPFLTWAEQVGFTNWYSDHDEGLAIEAADASVERVDPGDWVVLTGHGFIAVKPEAFAETYRALST